MQSIGCGILVPGARPAGLPSTLAAARCGKPIIILDDNPRPGGQIWRGEPQVPLPWHARRSRRVVAEHPNITLLSGARLIACPTPHSVALETADDCGEIRWRRLILCCDAGGLSLPFSGWMLPNVTGAGDLQAQIKHDLRLKGEHVVITDSGPLLLAVANTVERAGGSIIAIIEQVPMTTLAHFAAGLWRWPKKLHQLGELLPTRCHPASQVIQVQGGTCLQSVTVRHQGQAREVAYDRLIIGYGLVPSIEPGAIFDCETGNQAIWAGASQHTGTQDIYAAGECTGFGGGELALAEGEVTGYTAANYPQKVQNAILACARWQRFAHTLHTTFALPESLKAAAIASTLLYHYEDTRCGNVQNAESWQAAKFASRCEMGTRQREVCATSARQPCGWPLPQSRELLSPARIDALIHLAEPEG